jgi:hypothetical protein
MESKLHLRQLEKSRTFILNYGKEIRCHVVGAAVASIAHFDRLQQPPTSWKITGHHWQG